MSRLARHKQDWEDLAELDPLWAISGGADRRHGGWDLDEFFARAPRMIDEVMATAHGLGLPAHHGRALDFGCGVGRMTRALSRHFELCVGVDISERMVDEARRLNAAFENLSFEVNARDDLAVFADASFDAVYSKLVLQHLPSRAMMRGYITEFARVLAPGGLLVFQLPSAIRLRYRVQHHRRLYAALRRLGLPAAALYARGLQPMRVSSMREAEAVEALRRAGARVCHIERHGSRSTTSVTYFATTGPVGAGR